MRGDTGSANLRSGRLHPPLLQLPLQELRSNLQRRRRFFQVSPGLGQGGADLVLLLPLLDDPIERPLADAEFPSGFLAVAALFTLLSLFFARRVKVSSVLRTVEES